jgi:hypothetical protein
MQAGAEETNACLTHHTWPRLSSEGSMSNGLSETLVTIDTTARCHDTGDYNLNFHCRQTSNLNKLSIGKHTTEEEFPKIFPALDINPAE